MIWDVRKLLFCCCPDRNAYDVLDRVHKKLALDKLRYDEHAFFDDANDNFLLEGLRRCTEHVVKISAIRSSLSVDE